MENTKEIKNDFVCFDLETTGFGKDVEIIEFGAIKVVNGAITEIFSELVKPEKPIPPKITKLTGISNEDVENCRSISAVLSEFLDFVDGHILVGHNIAAFDIPIIRRIAKENLNRDFNVYYVDTLRMSQKIKDIEDHKLQTLLDHYGLTNENAHRASQDCEATIKLLKAMCDNGIKADVKYSCEDDEPWTEFDVEDKEALEIEICEDEFSDVQEYNIVLTGEFKAGSRADVKAALQMAGAQIFDNVSNKIDYLIIGACGSDEWKFANGGSKILRAQKLNITILSEKAVSKILKSYLEKMQTPEQLTLDDVEITEDALQTINDIFLSVANEMGYNPNYYTAEPNFKDKDTQKEKLLGYSLSLDKTLFAKTNTDLSEISVKNSLVSTDIRGVIKQTPLKSPMNSTKLLFENSTYGIEFLKFVVLEYSKAYTPSERFGCCHLYIKCSDEKRCLANDKFHAKGCFYRENLENGHIFYGKNTNQ